MRNAYNKAVADWQVSNNGKRFSINEVAYAANVAIDTAFTRRNIIAGFESTGIYPVNSNRYTDEDFLAASSTTTDFQSDQCDEENEEGSPRAIISTATEEPNKESDKTSLRQWLRSGDENIDVLDSSRPITIGNDEPSTSAISNASSQIDGEENTSEIAENRPTEETETTTSNDSITHHSQNSHDTPSTKKIA